MKRAIKKGSKNLVQKIKQKIKRDNFDISNGEI